MMTTLVVGPFYLSETLDLGPVEAGLVMSIGPGVAALVGLPAGRLVDARGSASVALLGVAGVVLGTGLMTVLPGCFGVAGYIGGLALITAGYGLFQAANNTSVMAGAEEDQRGLTSALLGLSRNLGLITGASAMGAVFALARRGFAPLGMLPGSGSGLQGTFLVATMLAVGAICIVLWGNGCRKSVIR
jgi:MFS family permease